MEIGGGAGGGGERKEQGGAVCFSSPIPSSFQSRGSFSVCPGKSIDIIPRGGEQRHAKRSCSISEPLRTYREKIPSFVLRIVSNGPYSLESLTLLISACRVIWAGQPISFHNPPNSDRDYMIFNVRFLIFFCMCILTGDLPQITGTT